jgi:glucokinase
MAHLGEAVGLDVGGSKILAVRSARDGAVLDQVEASTPADDQDATLAAMVEAARSLMTEDVLAVGIGAAGMVDVAAGVLRFAPNLAWRDLAIAEHMQGALGVPCQLDNDANVTAYGEFRFGSGRGYRHMLLVTVGTGIGGGIIVDGRLFRGANGYAAEIGHIIVEPDGPACGCGNRGCWEQVASGSTIGRLGSQEARKDPEGVIASSAGGDPEAVTGRHVTDAARAGDAPAIGILATVGGRLGSGIAGLVNVLDPQVVVVGGGAVVAGDLLLEPAREAFIQAVEGSDRRPTVPILAAQLGTAAGAVGAAALALEELGRPR